MIFDFDLSFELNVVELVSTYNEKGKMKKGSDNYLVLQALYNQHYIDNEVNRVERADGSRVGKTSQRIWDLTNKFGVENIQHRWVKGKRGSYKEFWLSRKDLSK